MKKARQMAVKALLRVEEDGAWSNLVLAGAMEEGVLDSRDKAFTSALFYGTLSRLITLDTCIAAYSSKAVAKIDPVIRAILQTGFYQLLYMPSVPERAVLHEAVALTKTMRKTSAGGFVNAVLRAFLRSGRKIPTPRSSEADSFSVEYSCSGDIVRILLDAYGEADVQAILKESLQIPPVFLRVNSLKICTEELIARLSAQGIEAAEDDLLPCCLRLKDHGAVAATVEFREGLFHIQDRSSQLCSIALGARPGDRILDSCAAPGGKSFSIAAAMENRGELVAADLHAHRIGLIEKRAKEMDFSCIRTLNADMSEPVESLGKFDRVLCDVPCSGLGVMRRRPELKYRPPQSENLSGIQYNILGTSSNYCKNGGTLLYSTCTLIPKENEEVADRFLREHPEFVPVALPGIGSARKLIMPGENGGDGFFMAAFQRVS